MSEFSDSYHLISNDVKEGIELLNRAGLKGFVFPESNGWVSLVAEDYDFAPNEPLIAANNGTLLHFVSAEDHGWYFSIYEGSKKVCHYECMWPGNLEMDDSELDMDFVTKLINRITSKDNVNCEDLHSLLYPKSMDDVFNEGIVSSRFAELIGLSNYEWLSYNYVSDNSDNQDIYPGVISVG